MEPKSFNGFNTRTLVPNLKCRVPIIKFGELRTFKLRAAVKVYSKLQYLGKFTLKKLLSRFTFHKNNYKYPHIVQFKWLELLTNLKTGY